MLAAESAASRRHGGKLGNGVVVHAPGEQLGLGGAGGVGPPPPGGKPGGAGGGGGSELGAKTPKACRLQLPTTSQDRAQYQAPGSSSLVKFQLFWDGLDGSMDSGVVLPPLKRARVFRGAMSVAAWAVMRLSEVEE